MKICFLSSMHPPLDKRVFDKEAVYVAQAGYDVTHLCPGSQEEAGVERGVKIVTYPFPKGFKGRIRQIPSLYKRALAQDADVYHCNEVDSWIVGVLLKIMHRKLCVFDVHEHYPSVFSEKHFPSKLRFLGEAFIRSLFYILSAFTDRIVLAKKTVYDEFRNYSKRVVIARNFALLSSVSCSGERNNYFLSGKLNMVHFGVFGKSRGWPQILEAIVFSGIRNFNFHVIGEINDGSSHEFDRRVCELGIEDRVKRTDWLPFDQAFQYLLSADVGIIAFQPGIQNHVYAMPHKMFDYMAAGLAVLCPGFAVEVAPIVKEAQCGLLVDPGDPEDIGRALRKLMMDPDELKAMGCRGQKAIREHYNWESEAKKLIKMYQELECRNETGYPSV